MTATFVRTRRRHNIVSMVSTHLRRLPLTPAKTL